MIAKFKDCTLKGMGVGYEVRPRQSAQLIVLQYLTTSAQMPNMRGTRIPGRNVPSIKPAVLLAGESDDRYHL